MRYRGLASDYDGTLASDGRVDEATLAALDRVRESGRRLLLVTGRQLDDLRSVFPAFSRFDRIVAENGAVVFDPSTRREAVLAKPPPEEFTARLRAGGVEPLAVGRVIVATWEPHESAVLAAIRDLGLELEIIFNKGAVMVLPSGVNKATGLRAALDGLGIAAPNTVAIGDAENDHAFLRVCGCGVAVANALQPLKDTADLVTRGRAGAGVVELIDALVATDLKEVEPRPRM